MLSCLTQCIHVPLAIRPPPSGTLALAPAPTSSLTVCTETPDRIAVDSLLEACDSRLPLTVRC
ncbi:hypothetical protein P171DRAFT_225665 [Karstenula rhodostoma CBS 690.94]|uniref:Uncharacterized protein n=1 Tax=Karstenula rhodostoma CBS 690.94 TaxID=1392251 RepID=A0A9P4PQD9_9PLEO|nr:hypothetical protein P171DRAFT_225665 [Karstenula rhodostoma CBS 690.94]